MFAPVGADAGGTTRIHSDARGSAGYRFSQFTDAVRQFGLYWLLLNQHAVNIDVECIRVELGEWGNARFLVRGLQDPRAPRGVLNLTRLQTRSRVGLRYRLVLETAAPSPNGQETRLPHDARHPGASF
jgi:hypothetical protein